MKVIPTAILLLLLASCDESRSKENGVIEIPINSTHYWEEKQETEPEYPTPNEEASTRGSGQAPVPEPGTLLILGTGIAITAYSRSRRSRDNVR